MKILIVVSNVYESTFKRQQHMTGKAIMIRDICDSFSDEIDCYVFPTELKNKGSRRGNLRIIKNNYAAYVKSIKLTILLKIIYIALTKGKRAVLNELINNYFDRLCKKIKPDVINFHDLTPKNLNLIRFSCRRRFNMLLTCHLYVGQTANYMGYTNLQKAENEIFNLPNINISFVSTGMKERFIQDYPKFDINRLSIILNATKISNRNKSILKPSIFENVGSKKVLLCIGNICNRKNQTAIIKSVSQMPEYERDKFVVVFLGKDTTKEFSEQIENSDCTGTLVYLGTVKPDEMPNFYYHADATITVSLNESFGLTIIEGFSYGIPAIISSNIDSFEDIYDDCSCIPCDIGAKLGIANAIKKCLTTDWNRDYIIQSVDKYSVERVGNQYENLYKKLIL